MIDRKSNSRLSHWWWTIDRPLFISVMLLVVIGLVLSMAASPAIAEHLGADSFYFVKRHVIFMTMGLFVMFTLAQMNVVTLRRLAVLGLLATFVALIMVLVVGTNVKGATRWIVLGGISLQPSEFLKPLMAVTTAWLLTRANMEEKFPGRLLALGVCGFAVLLLVLQPDIGMSIILLAVFVAQFVIAGLPLLWIGIAGVLMCVGLFAAYMFLPHVSNRIDGFIDPNKVDNYQTATSLRAFSNGGFFGVGPGEGVVKTRLPDAHTDFIFAVAGEEFGVLTCLMIVALFSFIVIRVFKKLMNESNLFVIYATAGLIIQFGLQAMINMGVSLGLVPNTGMTLPFISYGGSSTLAIALNMGMILAFTRKQFGAST